jgi:hypothetical protein
MPVTRTKSVPSKNQAPSRAKSPKPASSRPPKHRLRQALRNPTAGIKIFGACGLFSFLLVDEIRSLERAPGICCALRVNPQKIADQAIFYPSNSIGPKVRSSPITEGFLQHQAQKIHKWTMPIRDWGAALNQFAIIYGENRVPL